MKSYYEAHKAEIKAAKKAYYQSHKEERKAKKKAYYEAHKDEMKAKKKAYREAHKEEAKAYREAHKEQIRANQKAYKKADVNALGQTKHNIRCKSNQILNKLNLYIPGYEIHHCFGYDDPSKFIYCSIALHLKIHQLLRDKNISADSDHWMAIRDLVNSSDEFWYIKC